LQRELNGHKRTQRGEVASKTLTEGTVSRRVAEAAEITKLLILFPDLSLRSPRSLREKILAIMRDSDILQCMEHKDELPVFFAFFVLFLRIAHFWQHFPNRLSE
jgi:hypothetical protein